MEGKAGCSDGTLVKPLTQCENPPTTCNVDYIVAIRNGCPKCFHEKTCLPYEARAQVFSRDFHDAIEESQAEHVAYVDMVWAFAAICIVIGILFAAFVKYHRKRGYYTIMRHQAMLDIDENDNINPFCQNLPADEETATLKSPRAAKVIWKSIINM